uniref:ShKT domain-containing protein n=1 Tax=Ascaris lumbricoides TaxID=6252 RepID=A0A0M3INP9_ASCLU
MMAPICMETKVDFLLQMIRCRAQLNYEAPNAKAVSWVRRVPRVVSFKTITELSAWINDTLEVRTAFANDDLIADEINSLSRLALLTGNKVCDDLLERCTKYPMNSSNKQCRRYLSKCRVCANYNRSCKHCTRKIEQPMKALVEYLCPQTCKVKLTTWEISYVDSALISSADRISRLAHRPNSSIDDQSKFFNQNYFQFPSRKDNKCDSAIVKSANNQNG